MAMKVKAIIWGRDRNNRVVRLSKKKIQPGGIFRDGDYIYRLHPDRFQVTTERPLLYLRMLKVYFATYYYFEGHANPFPVPDGKGLIFQHIQVNAKDYKPGDPIPDATYDLTDGFRAVVDNGINDEEMAAIFNPWFYRTIAPTTTPVWEKIQFYLILGIAFGVGYLIWGLSNGKLPGGA